VLIGKEAAVAGINRPEFETLMAPAETFMATQLASMDLSARHRELVVLAVAHSLNALTVFARHTSISGPSQITDSERLVLTAGSEWEFAILFAPDERALVRFALAVLDASEVSGATLTDMRRHFSDREIVETITVVGSVFRMTRMSLVLDSLVDLARAE
jgi:alkylhydroperoxidase family enzyme